MFGGRIKSELSLQHIVYYILRAEEEIFMSESDSLSPIGYLSGIGNCLSLKSSMFEDYIF